jgi:hypothetical protein
VFTWLTVVQRRRGTRPWHLSLVAGVAVTLGLIDWALVVAPMNGVLNTWTTASLPPTWTRVRNRWEIGHAVQAALFAVGFVALTAHARRGPDRDAPRRLIT